MFGSLRRAAAANDGQNLLSAMFVVVSAAFAAWSIGDHMFGKMEGRVGFIFGSVIGIGVALCEAYGLRWANGAPTRTGRHTMYAAFAVGVVGVLLSHEFLAWQMAQGQVQKVVERIQKRDAALQQADSQASADDALERMPALEEAVITMRARRDAAEALQMELAGLPSMIPNRRVGEIQTIIGAVPDNRKYQETTAKMSAYVDTRTADLRAAEKRRDAAQAIIDDAKYQIDTGAVRDLRDEAAQLMAGYYGADGGWIDDPVHMLPSLVPLGRLVFGMAHSDPNRITERDAHHAGVVMFAILSCVVVFITIMNIALGTAGAHGAPATNGPVGPLSLTHGGGPPDDCVDPAGVWIAPQARVRASPAVRTEQENTAELERGIAQRRAMLAERDKQDELGRELRELDRQLGGYDAHHPLAGPGAEPRRTDTTIDRMFHDAHAAPAHHHVHADRRTALERAVAQPVHEPEVRAARDSPPASLRREVADLHAHLRNARAAEDRARQAYRDATDIGHARPDELAALQADVDRAAADRADIERELLALQPASSSAGPVTVNVSVITGPDGIPNDAFAAQVDWNAMRARARAANAPIAHEYWVIAPDGRILDTRVPGARDTQIWRDFQAGQRDRVRGGVRR